MLDNNNIHTQRTAVKIRQVASNIRTVIKCVVEASVSGEVAAKVTQWQERSSADTHVQVPDDDAAIHT